MVAKSKTPNPDKNCPFGSLSEEEVLMKLSNVIENHIKNRDVTVRETKQLAEIFTQLVNTAIMDHIRNCTWNPSYVTNVQQVGDNMKRIGELESELNGQEKGIEKGSKQEKEKVATIFQIFTFVIAISSIVLTLAQFIFRK